MSTSFFKLVKHPLKFRLFLLSKLPSAYFSGVRIKEIDTQHCQVTVPYKWFSTNPFKSTYFACLGMAAEMSSGVLALAHIYNRKPAVSMLVQKIEGTFLKKAIDKTTFICNDGLAIQKTIEEAIATGEGKSIIIKSIGYNIASEVVAEFLVTWSFKVKKSN
jgi:hypothetical protein